MTQRLIRITAVAAVACLATAGTAFAARHDYGRYGGESAQRGFFLFLELAHIGQNSFQLIPWEFAGAVFVHVYNIPWHYIHACHCNRGIYCINGHRSMTRRNSAEHILKLHWTYLIQISGRPIRYCPDASHRLHCRGHIAA